MIEAYIIMHAVKDVNAEGVFLPFCDITRIQYHLI